MQSRSSHTRSVVRAASPLLALVGLAVPLLAACGSSSNDVAGPSPYAIGGDTVKAGQGLLQLGPNPYPFTVVNCGVGPLPSETASVPAGKVAAQRVWGLYGNGEAEGRLFTIAITQYRSRIGTGPVTITETVQVRMDVPAGDVPSTTTTIPAPTTTQYEPPLTDGTSTSTGPTTTAAPTTTGPPTTPDPYAHLGLSAQRYRGESEKTWHDRLDPSAVVELVQRTGDTYRASGRFGTSDVDPASPDVQSGHIAARCPAPGAPTSSGAPNGSSS